MTLLNNRYQIVKSLGKGGFGQTFLAVDTHLPSQRPCAIKQLKPSLSNPSQKQWLEERFKQEAAILESLGENHDQIPRLYAYFQEEDEFYLVQEYIEGITLTQRVQQEGTLSETEVERLLISLLRVLEYVHQQQKIHRDIKPDNIILRSRDRQPILIDFGAVKEAVTTMMQSGGNASVAIGTPGFMASEQAAGRPLYSSDLYSLALTAVFLLSGKLPQELASDPQSGEILWRQALPQIHSNLAAVLDRALRYHPRDRYANATEMLQGLLQGGGVDSEAATIAVSPRQPPSSALPDTQQPTRVMAASESSRGSRNQSRWGWGVAVGVVGAIALFIGYGLFASQDNRDPDIVFSPSPTPSPSPSPSPTPSPSPSPSPTPSPTPTPTPSPPPQNTSIPVFSWGTSQNEVIAALGEPSYNRRGYFPNTRAVGYNDYLPGEANLGFIFDSNTGRLRQSEVSFESSVEIAPIEATLKALLGGNLGTVPQQSLEAVYNRQTDLRSFSVGDFRGMIQRDRRDRLYLAVWEKSFRP